MKLTPSKFNSFMMLKLPLAWLGGVRVKSISSQKTLVVIKHKWINQNPFRSMFWAAQGMAAEMATGALVIKAIKESNRKISMLVTQQHASFYKKATGRIEFACEDGDKIQTAINKTLETGEGQVFELIASGINEDGVEVSKFSFEWSIKVKS